MAYLGLEVFRCCLCWKVVSWADGCGDSGLCTTCWAAWTDGGDCDDLGAGSIEHVWNDDEEGLNALSAAERGEDFILNPYESWDAELITNRALDTWSWPYEGVVTPNGHAPPAPGDAYDPERVYEQNDLRRSR